MRASFEGPPHDRRATTRQEDRGGTRDRAAPPRLDGALESLCALRRRQPVTDSAFYSTSLRRIAPALPHMWARPHRPTPPVTTSAHSRRCPSVPFSASRPVHPCSST